MTKRSPLEIRLTLLFQQAREFVEHEDDLVDRRLKWVIAISGFLFAAYGATWIAWPKNLSSEVVDSFDHKLAIFLCLIRISFAICGFLSARVGAISIEAAHLAIRGITRKYNNFIKMNRRDILDEGLQVWKLIGDRITHLPGFYSSNYTPFGLATVWLVLAGIDATILCLLLYSIKNSLVVSLVWIAILISIAYFCIRMIIQAVESRKKLEYSGRSSWTLSSESGEYVSKRSVTWISEKSFRTNLKRKQDGGDAP